MKTHKFLVQIIAADATRYELEPVRVAEQLRLAAQSIVKDVTTGPIPLVLVMIEESPANACACDICQTGQPQGVR